MFKFHSIGARLAFWFFIIAITPLFMVNIAIYIHIVHSMKVSIFNRLEALRDIKVNELKHWLEERIMDIRIIASDHDIRALEISRDDILASESVISEARAFLKRYLQNYDDFHEIFIINPYTRKILISSNETSEGKILSRDSPFDVALQGFDLFIEDIHYSPTLNRPCMTISTPVFNLRDDNSVKGILVARINLENSLYRLLSNHTGMGETGENLIVSKDAVVLNELRWYKDAPLNLKVNTKGFIDASFGRTGVVETIDYRGEKVLAAYTYIPQPGWGFIAKQDLEEVYAPIYRLRRWMIIILFITLLGVAVVAFHVSKSISNPIKELYKGSEIIGSGNLDYKVGTDAKDEIGELSRRFDMMIEKLKAITASRDELNREIAERKHLEKMLLEIKEHERRRIGQDLHDTLGQQLTAISFKAQGLENILRKKMMPEAEDAARLIDLIDMAKVQVKSLSTGLSPIFGKDEWSLMSAMVDLAFNSEALFGILCVVRCIKGVPVLYNTDKLEHLYRIAQEAITNAARHAKPKQIEILLSREGDTVTLTIKDDGRGFDLQGHKKGIGLEIMRYRARIINASLDIHSEINKGTSVICTFSDPKRGGDGGNYLS